MPPKKPHKKLRRGLLGARIADSDEDDDWVPPGVTESPTPRATRAAGGSRAAAAPSQQRAVSINLLQSSDDDDENLDVPLSVRKARLQAAASPAAAGSRVRPGAHQGVRTAALPSDVLVPIFKLACAQAAIPTAGALACVCRQWRDVAGSLPELWARLNLQGGEEGRRRPPRLTDALAARLADRGRWRKVEYVRFAERKALTDAALASIARGAPGVTTLDLSGCKELRQEQVEAALAALPLLATLDVSECVVHPRGSGLDAIVRAALTPRPGRVTSALQTLKARKCPYLSRAFMQVFAPPRAPGGGGGGGGAGAAAAGAAAPGAVPHLLELRHVDLSGSGVLEGRHQLHPEKLQAAAPNVEIFAVSGLGGVFGWDVRVDHAPGQGGEAGGWPHLRRLEVGSAELFSALGQRDCFSCLTNALLLRLASKSPLLSHLDLSGCNQHGLTPEVLAALPCRGALRVLRLRRCRIGSDAGLQVAAEHFGATLEVVDVSGCGGSVTDAGVQALALSAPRLRELDLAGSAVTEAGLAALLEHCAQLETVDVSSCRSLPRALRHAAQETDNVHVIRRLLAREASGKR